VNASKPKSLALICVNARIGIHIKFSSNINAVTFSHNTKEYYDANKNQSMASDIGKPEDFSDSNSFFCKYFQYFSLD